MMRSLRLFVVLASIFALLVLVSATSAPVFADSLVLLSAGNCNTSTTVASGGASVSCPFTNVDATGTATATGNLSTGSFGASGTVTNVCNCLEGGSLLEVYADVTYNFAVSGLSNGTAAVSVAMDGTLTPVTLGLPPTATANLNYQGESVTINGSPGPTAASPLATGVTNLVVTTPITDGTATLVLGLEVVADNSCGSVNPACTTAIADFLDPMTITGASAYDASGNLVSDASFVSESGFNPNASSSVPTPEPSSIFLLGLGLLGVGAMGFVRRRTMQQIAPTVVA